MLTKTWKNQIGSKQNIFHWVTQLYHTFPITLEQKLHGKKSHKKKYFQAISQAFVDNRQKGYLLRLLNKHQNVSWAFTLNLLRCLRVHKVLFSEVINLTFPFCSDWLKDWSYYVFNNCPVGKQIEKSFYHSS